VSGIGNIEYYFTATHEQIINKDGEEFRKPKKCEDNEKTSKQ
jgi:hypothetical protein